MHTPKYVQEHDHAHKHRKTCALSHPHVYVHIKPTRICTQKHYHAYIFMYTQVLSCPNAYVHISTMRPGCVCIHERNHVHTCTINERNHAQILCLHIRRNLYIDTIQSTSTCDSHMSVIMLRRVCRHKRYQTHHTGVYMYKHNHLNRACKHECDQTHTYMKT